MMAATTPGVPFSSTAPAPDGGTYGVNVTTAWNQPSTVTLRRLARDGTVVWSHAFSVSWALAPLVVSGPSGQVAVTVPFGGVLSAPSLGLAGGAGSGEDSDVVIAWLRSDGSLVQSWVEDGPANAHAGATGFTREGELLLTVNDDGRSVGQDDLLAPTADHVDGTPFGALLVAEPGGDLNLLAIVESSDGAFAAVGQVSIGSSGATIVGYANSGVVLNGVQLDGAVRTSGGGQEFVAHVGSDAWVHRFSTSGAERGIDLPPGGQGAVLSYSPAAFAPPGGEAFKANVVEIRPDGTIGRVVVVQSELWDRVTGDLAANGDLVISLNALAWTTVTSSGQPLLLPREGAAFAVPTVFALDGDGGFRWTASLSPETSSDNCGSSVLGGFWVGRDGMVSLSFAAQAGMAYEGAHVAPGSGQWQAIVDGWIGKADFFDVDTAHPFRDEIRWMVEEGLSTGYWNGTFDPTGSVSRQALVAFLWRLAGSPEAEGVSPFSDVGPTHPFHEAIEWASSEGIVNGYPGGTFRPGDKVGRQALAAVLWRSAGSPVVATGAAFSDVPSTHPFAAAIAWMVDAELTAGYADGTFRPASPVSRQALAAFLQRSVDSGVLDPPP